MEYANSTYKTCILNTKERDERSTDGVMRDCEKSGDVTIDRNVNCAATNARVSFSLNLLAHVVYY